MKDSLVFPFKVSSGFFEHNINMHSFRPFAPIYVLVSSSCK